MNNDNIFNQNTDEKLKESINLKSIKDITLANGKRMLVMYEGNSYEPIVINIDYNLDLLNEIYGRMKENPNYQGGDPTENTKAIIEEIAKEQNGFETVIPIEMDKINEALKHYMNDPEKLKAISALVKDVEKKNLILPEHEKYAYIDLENEFVISNSGKVLEAKKNEKDELVVQSPEYASEYKDEDINPDEFNGGSKITELSSSDATLKDAEYTEDEIENVYDEVFSKGGVPDELKAGIISKLKAIGEDPNLLENRSVISSEEKAWFYEAYSRMEELKKKKTKTLTYEKEAGISSYVYIALVVLVIVFAIFMFIVFRR
ncbi:MAG: hypothetical protein IKZ96_01660 [Bacilli bacterium]|nr:hypothetical protein [Bacilli bacterium]